MDKKENLLKGLNNTRLLSFSIIIIIGIVLGLLISSRPSAEFKLIPGDYQAVFLSNGQVYFGKIFKITSKFLVLKDIYYLQLNRPLQDQNTTLDKKQPDLIKPKSNLILIKLGRELHGPQDQMTINREHILFIEGLKNDSAVLKAIREYENNKNKQ